MEENSRWKHTSERADRAARKLESALTEVGADLLLVRCSSTRSVGDDHARMCSRRLELDSSSKLPNGSEIPLCPLQTAACCALTRSFLSGHYAKKQEMLREIVATLLQSIGNCAPRSSASPLSRAVFAADRHCMTRSVVDFVVSRLQCQFLGSSRRDIKFPFTCGGSPISRSAREKRYLRRAQEQFVLRAKVVAPKKDPSTESGASVKVEALARCEAANERASTAIHNIEEH